MAVDALIRMDIKGVKTRHWVLTKAQDPLTRARKRVGIGMEWGRVFLQVQF